MTVCLYFLPAKHTIHSICCFYMYFHSRFAESSPCSDTHAHVLDPQPPLPLFQHSARDSDSVPSTPQVCVDAVAQMDAHIFGRINALQNDRPRRTLSNLSPPFIAPPRYATISNNHDDGDSVAFFDHERADSVV